MTGVQCFWCRGSGRSTAVSWSPPQVYEGSQVWIKDGDAPWVIGKVSKVLGDGARLLAANHWPFEVRLPGGKTCHSDHVQTEHLCTYCDGTKLREGDAFDRRRKNITLRIHGEDVPAHKEGTSYFLRKHRTFGGLSGTPVGIRGVFYPIAGKREEPELGPHVVRIVINETSRKVDAWDEALLRGKCPACGYPRQERSCPACA